MAGILLGSAVGALTSTVFSSATLEAWGWRVPFMLGLGVGLVGLYLRRHLRQQVPVQALEPASASPVLEALRTRWRGILRVAGLSVLNAVGFYTLFVYAVTYFEQISTSRQRRRSISIPSTWGCCFWLCRSWAHSLTESAASY